MPHFQQKWWVVDPASNDIAPRMTDTTPVAGSLPWVALMERSRGACCLVLAGAARGRDRVV